MYSIEVKNLTKLFGHFVSVDHISFNVKEGEVFGFLGANGAGKSTTIRMLCGILEPTSGDAFVGGYSITKDSDKIKTLIGYMSQKFSLYSDLTVEENIRFFGGIYGLDNSKLSERMDWILEMADLKDRKETLTQNLAAGYKQRLALGCAVIHTPRIVFLDEPTGGVDPISRRNFWDLINSLSMEGITVFVTTHYLDEAEFCNRIMMIDSGKIIAGGTPSELKNKYLKNTLLEIECDKLDEANLILNKTDIVKSSAYFGNMLHVTLKSDVMNIGQTDESIVSITNLLHKNYGIRIKSIGVIQPSLEDVFVNLLEKRDSET